MCGTWTQGVAQSWLVYKLTGSAYWLGIVTLCSQLPAFLLSPIAGVVCDRVERRQVLVTVLWLSALQAGVLAVLVLSHQIELWHILTLAVSLGVINSFEITARHSFAVDLVGKADLNSAISLNTVIVNSSRVVGPAIAGMLIPVLGEGWCFFVNSVSCIPVAYWLMQMPRTQKHVVVRSSGSHEKFSKALLEAVRYSRSHPLIYKILLLSGFVSLVACPFSTLLPVFAKKVLQGNPNTLALLTSSMGIGAIFGSLYCTHPTRRKHFVRALFTDVLGLGGSLLLLGFSNSVELSAGAMFGIGWFMMSVFPALNSALQHAVEDRMRGRVISLYSMTFQGMMPLGGLIMGWSADRISAPRVVLASGMLTASAGVFFLARMGLKRSSLAKLLFERFEFTNRRDSLTREKPIRVVNEPREFILSTNKEDLP